MKTPEEILHQLEVSERAMILLDRMGGGESTVSTHGGGYIDGLRWVLGLKDIEKDLNGEQ